MCLPLGDFEYSPKNILWILTVYQPQYILWFQMANQRRRKCCMIRSPILWRKTMKRNKFLTVCLVLAMLLMCCACSNTDKDPGTTASTGPEELTAAQIAEKMQEALTATPCSKMQTVMDMSMMVSWIHMIPWTFIGSIGKSIRGKPMAWAISNGKWLMGINWSRRVIMLVYAHWPLIPPASWRLPNVIPAMYAT